MTQSQCLLGATPLGPAPHRGQPCRHPWQAQLPTAWRTRVIRPETFRVDREYEVPARRVVGYETSGAPCFCSFDYRQVATRSDDDEDLYEVLVYAESLRAWRLHNGRWLVHRRVQPFGEEGEELTTFGFESRMPR